MNKDCELIKDLATRLNIHIHTFNDKLNPLWKSAEAEIRYITEELKSLGWGAHLDYGVLDREGDILGCILVKY